MRWSTDPQKQADFAYRGQHITTLAAKKLIKAYYGQAQKYAYLSAARMADAKR
jgi:feruloyl esterase